MSASGLWVQGTMVAHGPPMVLAFQASLAACQASSPNASSVLLKSGLLPLGTCAPQNREGW